MVEIELSVLSKQCLSRRIGELSELDQQVTAWVEARNRKKSECQLAVYSQSGAAEVPPILS